MTMLKLYTAPGRARRYWEAWDEERTLVVHEGVLGTTGKTRRVKLAKGEGAKAAIVRLARAQLAAGFAEVADEDHFQIIVRWQLDGWGSGKDLDVVFRAEELLNEALGWSGNGHVDGNDIGGGEMGLYCFAVDPDLAVATVVETLRRPGFLTRARVFVRAPHDELERLAWSPSATDKPAAKAKKPAAKAKKPAAKAKKPAVKAPKTKRAVAKATARKTKRA